jgi:endonuclease YncB( thermonuclease family)
MKMTAILSVLALLGATLTSAADPIERSQIFVLDGDTIIVTPEGNQKHMKDEEYRLIGFDTPETTRGKCPAEIEKGHRATARLMALLDKGKLLDLQEVQCSCAPGKANCNWGRRCGRLTVDGKDVGEVLIAEGLAVPYVCQPPGTASSRPCPRQKSWCH